MSTMAAFNVCPCAVCAVQEKAGAVQGPSFKSVYRVCVYTLSNILIYAMMQCYCPQRFSYIYAPIHRCNNITMHQYTQYRARIPTPPHPHPPGRVTTTRNFFQQPVPCSIAPRDEITPCGETPHSRHMRRGKAKLLLMCTKTAQTLGPSHIVHQNR